MASRLSNLVAAALLATTSFVPLANVASAMPLDTLVIRKATNVEAVHWRGRGWGIGAAIVGGAILGGMLAAPYYGPGPYFAYGPGPANGYGYGYGYGYRAYGPGPYYGEGYAAAPGYAPGGAVAYCVQRFRSYDVRSGTYVGYDGLRHPCP
jgi:hypothetical protein